MKLALIGYGRMGKVVERLATTRGHEIAAIVDPAVGDQNVSSAGVAISRELTADALQAADICVEFTQPHVAADNLLQLCQWGKRVVTGTTGWYQRLDEVGAAAREHSAAIVYGANFSIGVNLFYRLVERAAELFGALDDRDIYVAETHHRAKADSPSGTARRLAEIVLSHSRTKKHLAPAALERAISADQLQVVATRAGWVTGIHRVGIESPSDSIVLEHRAHSREIFADGALRAAEWLVRARAGLYRFEDILDDLLARR